MSIPLIWMYQYDSLRQALKQLTGQARVVLMSRGSARVLENQTAINKYIQESLDKDESPSFTFGAPLACKQAMEKFFKTLALPLQPKDATETASAIKNALSTSLRDGSDNERKECLQEIFFEKYQGFQQFIYRMKVQITSTFLREDDAKETIENIKTKLKRHLALAIAQLKKEFPALEAEFDEILKIHCAISEGAENKNEDKGQSQAGNKENEEDLEPLKFDTLFGPYKIAYRIRAEEKDLGVDEQEPGRPDEVDLDILQDARQDLLRGRTEKGIQKLQGADLRNLLINYKKLTELIEKDKEVQAAAASQPTPPASNQQQRVWSEID